MKNEFIEKINRIGKAGYAVSRICSTLVYIAAVCCAVAAVLLALVPRDGVMVTTGHSATIEMDMTHSIMPSLVGIDTESDGSFELNGIKYDNFKTESTPGRQTATASSTPYTYSLRDMLWVFVCGGAVCAALILTMKKITALFDSFRSCETPFTPETADRFSKLAFSFLPVIALGWVTEAVVERVTTGVWNIVIGIDLTVVMIVVVIMLLAEIFRYGAMLQQESDETL